MGKIFAAGLAALLLAACSQFEPEPDRKPERVEAALQETLDRLVAEYQIPGIQAAVMLPGGSVVEASSGLADLEDETPMTSDLRLASGSIGKTYVAATIMGLVEEGVLDLDAKVADYVGGEDWYAGFPNGDLITLGQLLNHSSGLPRDYLESPEILAGLKRSIEEGIDFEDQGITHEDYIRTLSGLEPAFAPGENFAYSDAAYAIGALVVEKMTGRTIEVEIQERFLGPLGLTNTLPLSRSMENVVSAYVPEPVRQAFAGVPAKSVIHGEFQFDPRLEWGGGGYVATAGDLARWGKAWFGGVALQGDYVPAIKEWANPFTPPQLGDGYGIGLQLKRESEFGERLYHGGYQLGFIARTEYLPAHEMSSALMINTIDPRYERYHDEIWRAVLAAFAAEE